MDKAYDIMLSLTMLDQEIRETKKRLVTLENEYHDKALEMERELYKAWVMEILGRCAR